MGLLSKLGGAVKEGVRNGAVNGLLKATGYNATSGKTQYSEYEYDANGNIKGVNKSYKDALSQKFSSNESTLNRTYDGKSGGLTLGTISNRKQGSSLNRLDHYPSKYYKAPSPPEKINLLRYESIDDETFIQNNAIDTIENNMGDNSGGIKNDVLADKYKLKLPDWSYADFINERAIWQKGLSSIFDEPAWFYFKIFFDFDTNHGLFGGLLNDTYFSSATNSAAKYLYSMRFLHKQEKPKDRISALYKFASILSYINTNAPWYFKSINGINKVLNPVLDDFSKERSIEIELMPDAIDMRLSTIMSLYSYACYDNFYHKEIIPANLRKFNMSIILFQSPLRYLHTSYTTHKKQEFLGINTDQLPFFDKLNKSEKKANYKNMSPNGGGEGNDFSNTMSMKIITLYGCEFSKETIGDMVPTSIANDVPFQLGKNSLKITYTYSTEHTMNEFYAIMFGTDGFYFNQYSNFQSLDGQWNGYVNKMNDVWNRQKNRYKTLSDTFDNLATGGTILGIIDKPKTYKEAIDATEAIMNGIGEDKNLLGSLGIDFALGLLGSSKNTDAPQGNIYGDYGIGSAYYKDKLEMLKNGVHERTTAPYYYDPYTGVRVDLHKSKHYTAYNFKNDVSTVKNFNVTNWLDNQATGLGTGLNDNLRDMFYGSNNFTQQPYRPNEYNKATAQEIDEKRFEGIGKSHEMIDDPNTWDRVEKPYNYEKRGT